MGITTVRTLLVTSDIVSRRISKIKAHSVQKYALLATFFLSYSLHQIAEDLIFPRDIVVDYLSHSFHVP